jgi:hypothetical protein
MRKLNTKQRIIAYDILHWKNKYPLEPLHLFLTRGTWRGKTCTLMCIIQNMLQYYIKQITNVDPLNKHT